jgi:hypothetical protein
VIALGRRRVVGGVALVALSVGIWSAQAGTPARPGTGSQATNLFAKLDKICRFAAPGTYGLPGHYCESPNMLMSAVNGESIDRQAAEHQRAAIVSAPDGQTPGGAVAAAIDARNKMAARGSAPQDSHTWTRNGRGPLQSADAGYDGVNGTGLVELAGRVTSFAYDAQRRTVYASSAGGGLFRSTDKGAHWTSAGDTLPTQLVGAVGYSSAGRGTLIVVSGDGSFGRYSLEGAGVFRSTDLGRTWTRAKGAPSDTFGFKVVVDPTNPKVVYVATGAGLFRSQDAGASFSNVKLPTGPCAGKSNRVKGCLLANVVTDLSVETPGGTGNAKGGRVIAAVGWRHGQAKASDGSVESPNNGIYTSTDGRPGTFTKSPMTGFTPQAQIGRIGLGQAYGPEQNHDYIYATVQNAKGGADDGLPPTPDIDTPVGAVNITQTAQANDMLEGVYVSSDFGQSWVKMADGRELGSPTTGSSLAVVFAVLGGYGAGVQAWYNNWIMPDPTRAVAGVPTRLLFGLEEVWENDDKGLPQNKPTHFRVIGRYFSGTTCLGLDLTGTLPAYACPTNRDQALTPTTTTHPDQHAVLYLPDGEGGVTLLVGNDGGVFTQKTGASVTDDFENSKWGDGANRGLDTLQPYNVARAKDGTIWMGLQDNGTAKIANVYGPGRKLLHSQRQIMTAGGDGFFVGVDPNNSNRAYGEYVGGAMSGTSDGGKGWSQMSPPITHGQFSTPFAIDPLDPNHVIIAGKEVVESGAGPATSDTDWRKVFDLGTAQHPGSSSAQESATDSANSQTAIDLYGANAYVGYCGTCDVLEDTRPFRSGLATNVGGKGGAKKLSTSGWHVAKAIGLPERLITSLAIDRSNPRVVYATVGSYTRRWTPPGTLDRATLTAGHLFKSVDAGEHFVDISGDLPNAPANWVTQRGTQLLVATDLGVFASKPASRCGTKAGRACAFEVLGKGLPATPVVSMQLSPWDCRYLTVASFGRGAWTYDFGTAACKDPVTAPKKLQVKPFANALVQQFDFESGAQGWVATSTDATGAMAWHNGSPGHSGSQSEQVLPYTQDSAATLSSPRMVLPQNSTVRVSWWKAQDTEPGFDALTLDWSSDGRTWFTVSNKAEQSPGFPQFSEDHATFNAPAGSLYLRFRLTSDALIASPPYLGVMLDDVVVKR